MCDVHESILDRRAEEFLAAYGRRPDTVIDYRELLGRPDIDAVSIATPNHTHTQIAIAAMRAGKDVYVEKPVSHNVWEGQQLAAWAKKTGRVVQCGTQARSSRAIQQAVAWVRSGGLGRVEYAYGTCYKPRPSIGKLAAPLPIPKDLNYDLWCGPADVAPIHRPKLHYDWHWDYNTGAGDMGNQGIHQVDIARWFLGESRLPPRVRSFGGRVGYEDGGNTANTQIVCFDYPAAPLIFETRGLPRSKQAQKSWGRSMDKYRGSQIGVIVQCEGGHVLSSNDYSRVSAFDGGGRLVKEFRGGGDHYRNFLDAVASADPAAVNGEVREGHVSSALCHVGNVSHQLGEEATADEILGVAGSAPLLAEGFKRMADHLRANDVAIDDRPMLTAGVWVSIDPAAETAADRVTDQPLWKRAGREGHRVPVA